jgi:hypothetical protein
MICTHVNKSIVIHRNDRLCERLDIFGRALSNVPLFVEKLRLLPAKTVYLCTLLYPSR